jgi:mycoredoxin
MNRADERIVMYTTTRCADCWRAKRIFAALEVPYREVNIERDKQGASEVLRLNSGLLSVPTIIFPDGSRLVEPRGPALEARLRAYVRGHAEREQRGSGRMGDDR